MNYLEKSLLDSIEANYAQYKSHGYNSAHKVTKINKYIDFGTGSPYGSGRLLWKNSKVSVKLVIRNRSSADSIYIEVHNFKTKESVWWKCSEPSYKFRDDNKQLLAQWYVENIRNEAWDYIKQNNLK